MTPGCLRTVLITVFLIALSHAHAATTNWTGATSAAWNLAGNWDNGIPTAGNDAVFPPNIPATGSTIMVAAGMVANSLTFNGSYTLSGGDITRSTATVSVATGKIATISTALGGTAGVGLTLNSTATAGFAGTLQLSGASTYTGATLISNGALNLAAAVSASTNGPLGNAAGALTLGDANTNTIGGSPAVIIVGPYAMARDVTIVNRATTGIYSVGSTFPSGASFSGTITISQPLTITQLGGTNYNSLVINNIASGVTGTHIITYVGPGSTNISGVIGGGTGTLAVVVNGGTLFPSGANTYTGGLTLNSGTLTVYNNSFPAAGTGTLTINGGTLNGYSSSSGSVTNTTVINGDFACGLMFFNGSMTLGPSAGTSRTITVNNDLEIDGAIANGTSATQIIKAGAGILVLRGNNTFSGGIILNAGTLSINAQGTSTTNSALGTGPLVINGGGISYITGLGNLSLTTKNPVTINSDFTYTSSGSTLNLSGGATTLGNAAGTSRTITFLSPYGDLALGAISNGTTANSLILNGGTGGSFDLDGNSAFTGGVTLNSGTLSINAQGTGPSNSALGTGPLVIAGGMIDNTSAAAINLTGTTNNAVIINGDFTFTGTQNLTLGTGASTLGTAAGTNRTITVAAGTLGLGSIANGTSASALSKDGPGALTLAGSNTFNGAVTVIAGRLSLTGTMTATQLINVASLGAFDIQATGANPAAPGRLSDSVAITLNGGVLSMEAPATADCTETIGSLIFTPGATNTVLLAANSTFKCQLTAGGSLPVLGAGTNVNLIRESTNATGTANLFFSGQTTNNAGPISGYTVNGQTAAYDATSATPQGLIPTTPAGTFISKANGNWGVTTTWVNGAVPATTDMVVIRHSVVVDLAQRTTQAVLFDQGIGALTSNGNKLINTSGLVTVLNSQTGTGTGTITAYLNGTGGVIKNGPGTLVLSGTNTYTGATVINLGTLHASSNQALGVNSAVTVANVAGATLYIDPTTALAVSVGSLTGGGANGGLINFDYQGSSLTIGGDNTSPAPYAGVITGINGRIIKVGTGTLTLSAASSYNVTEVDAGILSINQLSSLGGNTLDLNGGTLQYTGPSAGIASSFVTLTGQSSVEVATPTTTLTLDNANFAVSVQGAGGLTKLGAGTLLLSNSQNTYTGVTKISAGTLSAPYMSIGGQPSSIGMSSNGAGNLIMDGGTLLASGITDRNYTITAGQSAIFSTPDSLEIDGAAAATAGNLVKTGVGDLTFTTAQGYTGSTNINAGVLTLTGNAGAIAASTAIYINPGAILDLNSVGYTEPATPPGRILDSATVTMNGGTFSMEAGTSGGRIETVGTLAFNGSTNTIILAANGNSKCQLISGGALPINAAPVNLIRNAGGGTGTANLLYSGQSANIAAPVLNYTVDGQTAKYDATSATPQGLIQSSGNIVVTQAAGTWGTAATWVGNAVPGVGDTVVIRHAVTLEAPHTAQSVMFDYVGTGSLSGSPLTNTSGIFNAISTVGTISAPIAGTSLVVSGNNGSLSLAGTNTYSGSTTIGSGTSLEIGNNGTSGTLGSGPVVNNGTLFFNRTDTLLVSNDISGSGILEFSSTSGTVILTGNNTYTGITLGGISGVLQIGNGGTTGTLGSGQVTAKSLTFDRSDSIVIAGDAITTGSIIQAGSGTLTLTGSIGSGAAFTANAGNLILAPSGALTITTATVNNAGTLTVASGASLTASSVTVNNSGTFSLASGLSMTVTTTTVNDNGQLTLGSGATLIGTTATLNTAGNLLVSAGATLNVTTTSVYNNSTLTVNGTASGVNVKNASAASPALAGCLLRGTGSVGAVTLSDSSNIPNSNAVIWPGLANTVGALTANEQLNVASLDFDSSGNGGGGKFAALINNSRGVAQKLVVSGNIMNVYYYGAFSFATDTTPNAPASYTVLSSTTGSIDFSFYRIHAPPGFVLGTHYDLRYSISGASPKLQSVIGPGVALGAGYNQMDVVFTGTSVTPVTVNAFTAQTEAAGVWLDWHCVSEFQNAGFNIYRRALVGDVWTRVNPALIAGRITNPDAKTYQFYDWAEPGVYEYKLESVSIQGSHETYRDISGPVVLDGGATLLSPLNGPLTDVRGSGALDAAISSIERARETAQGRSLRAKFAAANSTGVSAVAIDDPRPIKATVQARAIKPGAGGPPAPQLCSTPAPQIAARWFSAKTTSAGSSYTAAKVTYSTPGVLLITQSMLPTGFDMNRVAIQREGRALTALAKTSAGLIVFGEGYSDDYTDKDALFLRSNNGATAAGAATQVSGLFASTLPVNTQAPMTASAEFHDVYFDFNLRPYNYPPWFSSQYLADGTDQSFSINAPNATCGAGSLIVNLWSLTQDHTLQVAVNGQPIGQAQWSGVGQMIQLTFQIPSGVLNAGANQIELITPAVNGDAGQIAFLHSMTLSYTQTLDGSQPLTINNLGGQAALYEVGNLPSASAWVVDARFPDRAALIPYETQAQLDGTFKLRFIGSAGRTGRFLVVPAGQEHLPDSVTKSAVKPLRAAPYLAVGPSQFSSAVEPLLMQRSKEGLRSAFVDQEQIFDYYNYGRYGPIGIQNAVRSVRPQFLLLVGRTTYDYRNYSGANVDPLCPAFLVSTTFWAQATSDSLFGDLGRGYPEVAVGRLPVNDASELSSALRHVLSNNGAPMSGVRVHAATDRADPAVADFPAQAAALAQTIPDMAWQANYLGVTYQTDVEVTAAMTSAANELADWIVYIGHGNALHLGSANNVILDTGSVQNWTGHAVFLQCTCAGNWMAKDEQNYHSLAIQALTQPQGGISASIGTSTYMNSDCAVEFASQLLKNANTSSMRWGTALMRTQQWAFTKGSSYYSD